MELATKQHIPTAVAKKTNSFFPKKTEPSFFSPVFVQPKLTVGPADDVYEREADTVAETVMRMPDQSSPSAFFPATQPISKIQRQCASCDAEERLQRMEEDEEESIQTKPDHQFDVRRKGADCEQDEKLIQPKRTIQRRCAECDEEEEAIQPKRDGSIQSKHKGDLVQRRCAACEQEENAIQRKAIGTISRKTIRSLLQRVCSECEKEDEPVSRKESSATSAPQVTSSVHHVLDSPGHPLDRSTRSFMESRFGYDFGDVRIHNDVQAHESSKDIHALAYTHGEHVVFGAGQYQPNTLAGKKLLAHELTHVVQQKEPGSKAIQRQLFFGQGGGYRGMMHRDQTRLQQLRNSPQTTIGPALTEKQKKYLPFKDEVVELYNKESFNPSFGLRNWIAAQWEANIPEVTVNVKYSSLGIGVIKVTKNGDYTRSEEEVKIKTGPGWILPVFPLVYPDFEEVDVGPEPTNFNAALQAISFSHKDLNVLESGGSLALRIMINAGKVTGDLGWAPGESYDTIGPTTDVQKIQVTKEAFIPLLFGKNEFERTFDPTTSYINALSKGILRFDIFGKLNIENYQQIDTKFGLLYDFSVWDAKLIVSVLGLAQKHLKLERNPLGFVFGNDGDFELSKEWKKGGFSAKLSVSYINSILMVNGQASYVDPKGRGDGSVSITVTDFITAERLFNEHLPAKKATVTPRDSFLDSNLPNKNLPLALTAWGNLHFLVNKEKIPIEGDAAFVVHPLGYIVTAGRVTLKKDYVLMERKADQMKVFERELLNKSIHVSIGSLRVIIDTSLYAGYDIGPLIFSDLTASGVYSNHPDPMLKSEIALSGTFDLHGILWGSLNVNVTNSVGTLGVYLVHLRIYVNLLGQLKLHVRATPTIGARFPDTGPEYFISGKLYGGGQLSVAVTGDIDFKIGRKPKPKEKKTYDPIKERHQDDANLGNWKIGQFGFELEGEYIIGSNKKPVVTFKKTDFDERLFAEKLAKTEELLKKSKATGKELEGGFKEGDKETGEPKSGPFEPIHHPNDPIGPLVLTDSFGMEGEDHMLYLSIEGTEAQPNSQIEMSSPSKDKLPVMLNDELEIVKDELRRIKMVTWSTDFSERQEEQIEELIRELEQIRGEAETLLARVNKESLGGDISDVGLEAVGDLLTRYGRMSGKKNIGRNTGSAKTQPPIGPSSPFKVPPPGVDVILELPYQKYIHRKKYEEYLKKGLLCHSINRAERDTHQVSKWDRNMKGTMFSSTKCLGVALNLMLSGTSTPARNILRPFWTPLRILGTNVADDQMRMTVDHLIEYQLRSLTGDYWMDEPWNFELLEPRANSSSGSKLKDNILKERQRLARLTGDKSWTTDDIKFTKLNVASGSAERYLVDEIERGKHLNDYIRLTNTQRDKVKYDECINRGGRPF